MTKLRLQLKMVTLEYDSCKDSLTFWAVQTAGTELDSEDMAKLKVFLSNVFKYMPFKMQQV